jgi:DNA-binding response OmpR family regulator
MSKRVLILDDERDSNTSVVLVLQDNGFRVDSYEDPILALENFKSCFYDLVILDIKMPQMSGFSVYSEIRKLDKRIKVCFLTAGDVDIFSSLPSNCFIRKPIGNEELLKRVHDAITTNS